MQRIVKVLRPLETNINGASKDKEVHKSKISNRTSKYGHRIQFQLNFKQGGK